MEGDAAPQQDVSHLPCKARELLAQAAVNGRLEGVLAGVKGDLSQLRSEARVLLAQASVDGQCHFFVSRTVWLSRLRMC